MQRHASPIEDADIEYFLSQETLHLTFTDDADRAYLEADFVVITTPTDYDAEKNFFDTTTVDSVIDSVVGLNPQAIVVIKSTVPVGYTAEKQAQYLESTIMFSPEFLREGHALHDNLFPSRIVVGNRGFYGIAFSQMLLSCSRKPDTNVLLTVPTEAETIKLFSNTYLAPRVSYFNELDTYAAVRGLDTAQIIHGVGLTHG